jgi:hypothetical protein
MPSPFRPDANGLTSANGGQAVLAAELVLEREMIGRILAVVGARWSWSAR